jgi:hypothetical protein
VVTETRRLKLLGVWYTNNAAPELLLRMSLGTIRRAAVATVHHDVAVRTSAWRPIADNPFPCHLGSPEAAGHAAILAQVRRCLDGAGAYDAMLFLEHDVLYPPDYFDRMGNALAAGAPVASNLDYEGLNETGWLVVCERHEPLHQLALCKEVALENLARAEAECLAQGWAYLEPQGDRSDWARLPPAGYMPAIHVNWPNGRFTNHGEIVFQPCSGGRLVHPFWGNFEDWWPLDPEPDTGAPQGRAAGGIEEETGGTHPAS